MKPKSFHWADQAAAKLVRTFGDKEEYVLASGITPSGVVHIGNFREVITVDLVTRAVADLGKKVKFLYSWDDFDTFRKVPKNLPNQEMLTENLRRPINRIPDPYAKYSSYAEYNEKVFETDIAKMGISPNFIYQSKRYEDGVYAEQIRKALENKDTIKAILDEFRTSPLDDSWLPSAIYCEKCDKDEMEYERYEGEWNYAYKCKSCGNEAVTDIRKTKNLKLNWRTDWPMRWAFEGVNFEPGGKDHSSQGGSFDTASKIVKAVWDKNPPVYLQYDFISIKGLGGKMSSSSGVLINLSEALEVYSPQILRWMFVVQKPNHDFAMSFDSDVIKAYDEFDVAERSAIIDQKPDNTKWALLRRSYELSTLDGKVPEKIPYRAPFRELCNRLQIFDGDIERTCNKFYSEFITDEADKQSFVSRAQCAWNWLQKHAPEEFKYQLYSEPVTVECNAEISNALNAFKQLIEKTDLDNIDTKDLNQLIYDEVIHACGIETPKEFFQTVYKKLIGRPQGPRLPSFVKEIGKTKLLTLL